MQKTIGKFRVQQLIGKGATGSVYLGEDDFTGQQVAIKVAHQRVFLDPVHGGKFKKMFINEASLAGKLRHPYIVSVYDAGTEEDLHYIVMEYVAGDTLKEFCSPASLLPFDQVVEIIFKCCNALEYANHQGVIHRDIKPANILLTGESEVKISDFGAALLVDSDLTQISDAVGSPYYMSPEHIRGGNVTEQSDIYSLGIVMYQMLSGHLPYSAENQLELIQKITREEPIPLNLVRPDVPFNLINIVERCIRKKPEDRYPSWHEFAQELSTANRNLEGRSKSVSNTEKFNTLKRLSFFQRFSDVELWEVLRISQWHRFSAETLLIREGKLGRSLFILATGNARIMKSGSFLGMLEEGQCFGEMAYIQEIPKARSASVIANTDVTIIKIKPETVQKASDQLQTSFNRELLKILANRLEKTTVIASL
jgi:serine/threonine protein kinase